MSIIGEVFIPIDALNNIFSQLDIKSLGRIQCVSKDFYKIANNDVVWTNLFKNLFANDASAEILGKRGVSCIIIRTQDELRKTAEAFWCRLKWGEKTRLECFFPDKSISPIFLEMGFGLSHEKGFKSYEEFRSSEANQIDCRIFLGDVNSLKKQRSSCSQVKSWIGASKLPRYEFSRSIFLLKADVDESKRITPIEVEIKEVDVGYGNTLGYCSSINGWKEPFELCCVPGDRGQTMWIGRVPLNEEIKFVKIDSNGNSTWENHTGNRTFSSIGDWRFSLKEQPISFS
jgi:hypothetical protein